MVETLFISPDMFNQYIAFDPSLWWNNHYLVRTAKQHLSNAPQSPKKLWYASSNAEDILPYSSKLAQYLQTESPSHIKWQFRAEPNEKHTTIFRALKEKALIWTFNESLVSN